MMTLRHDKFDGAFSVDLIISAAIHLAVAYLLLTRPEALFSAKIPVQETYYVDVVNLPVASPRAGIPSRGGGNGGEAPSSPAAEKSMTMPVPTQREPREQQYPTRTKTEAHDGRRSPTKLRESAATTAESAAFAKKIARLKGKAEARQEEATIERLRRRIAATGDGRHGMLGGAGSGGGRYGMTGGTGSGRAGGGGYGSGRYGMPGGTGTEAGSSYEDYIKSRLEDALKSSSYSTANPVVVVRLTIDVNGRIIRQKVERSSGDRIFELSVQRAIDIVSENLYPPPDHKIFENGFIFKPRAIESLRR